MMEKSKPVLHDHRKKGNTFFPPFLAKSKQLGIDVHSIEWRKNILPELIWLAPLVHDYGYERACMLASALSNSAGEATNWSIFPHIGTVSWFARLTTTQKSNVRRRLQAAGVLNDICKSLQPLARLYPKFPLKFLIGKDGPMVRKSKATEYMAPLLWECLFRGERLPTLVQGAFYAMNLASGRMYFAHGVNPPLPQDLTDYPESDKSQSAASFIRCTVGQLEVLPVNSFWAEYFWQKGNDIGKCQIRQEPGTSIGAVSQAFIMHHLKCFHLYCEETSHIWESVESKRVFNLYDQLRDEILTGLAARIYRLGVHIASFIPNWVEDVGQVYVRMAVESYIYWVWFRERASSDDFKSFYDHGLGQQKLFGEHLKTIFEQEGLSQEGINEANAGLEFLKSHRLPEFVPVNLGSPVGKDLRTIAKEAGLSELYSLVFSPTSSMVHGMYDSLERYYLRRCANPFHCLHRVPFYWSKNSVSEYGPANTLILADWVLAEILKDVGAVPPVPMPGEHFLTRLRDDEKLEEYWSDPEQRPKVESNEEFVSELRMKMMGKTGNQETARTEPTAHDGQREAD